MADEGLIKRIVTSNIDDKYFKQFKTNFDDGILLPHNQGVYGKIIKGFSRSKRVLFEQATGTGKSYLAAKFLSDHARGKRVLFVSPANIIDGYFVDTLLKTLLNFDDERLAGLSKPHKLHMIKNELNIDFNTCLYQGLKSQADENYDIIIFDEAHRMGAPVWGQNVETLLNNNPNAICLGMSATVDRNDGVDVRKFFNNNNPVSTYSLVDAFNDDILPNLEYHLGKIDYSNEKKFNDESIKELDERLKTATGEQRKEILAALDELKKAKRMIAESEDITTIFAENFNSPQMLTGKFIVFCPAGDEILDDEDDAKLTHRMKSIMSQTEKWFSKVDGIKKIKKYSVYSKRGDINRKVIKAFEKDKTKSLKLLFAINMLNEGFHINDVDGIIMLRGTASRIIYLQQLGRVLSVCAKDSVRVLDLVANLNSVDIETIRAIAEAVNRGKPTGTNAIHKNGKQKISLIVENNDKIQYMNALQERVYNLTNWFEKFIQDLLAWKVDHPNFEGLMSHSCPFRNTVGAVRLAKKGKGSNNLTEEMIARLDAIGFPWTVENNWFEEFIANLLVWKIDHPNFEGLQSKECPFANMVNTVRQAKKGKGNTKLTEEMIARLNAIGFPWEAEKYDWFEKFMQDLLIWKVDHPNFENLMSKECPFAGTVNAVRQAKKGKGNIHLTEEMIVRLNAIGFPWEARDWFEEFYHYLLAWKVDHPNLENLTSRDCHFNKVVSAVRLSKKAFDAGKKPNGYELDEEMIARLNAIGFPWERKDWFEEFYQNLLAWKVYHPSFEGLLSRKSPLRNIASQVRMAKKAFDAGKKPHSYELDEEKIAKLDEIGFPWGGETKKVDDGDDNVDPNSGAETGRSV